MDSTRSTSLASRASTRTRAASTHRCTASGCGRCGNSPASVGRPIRTGGFAFCSKHVPKWNSVSISGYHIREAGSTAAQELAFTLADGQHYVEQCLARGMNIDEFAPRLSFFFNAHNDLFEEVAKYRAARFLWADTLRQKYGASKEASWKLRFHAQTAG